VGYGSIGAPTSDLVFVSPKATLDATGRLHVLWAEPPTHEQIIAPYQWLLLRTSSIWTAVYEPRHGWSPPARIYSGPIDWNRLTSDAITGVAHNESLTAIPNEAGGVLVLSLRDGQWSVTAIPGRTQPAYVSVLGLGDRRLLAVVTADTTQQQDRNSVFLYSQDGNAPWRPLTQVQRSGMQAAMEIRLLKERGGRVHLVWRQMIREDYFVIRHMQSDDEGASFSEASDLVPGGLIQNVQAAVDTCGRLHVVYEDWSERSMNAVRIGYANWAGRWSMPQRLHRAYTAGELALASRSDDTLLLAFLGTTGKATDRDGWAMMYSELR
ncbi:MAG TPA: hypothetical protein VIP11_26410, partial [Gemmatimonadaceae bacterium]